MRGAYNRCSDRVWNQYRQPTWWYNNTIYVFNFFTPKYITQARYFMTNFLLFVFLTFIIVVVVILMTPDLTTAMLIVSLLANLLVIASSVTSLHKQQLNVSSIFSPPPPPEPAPEPEPEPKKEDDEKKPLGGPNLQSEMDDPQSTLSMYGPAYTKFNGYKSTYSSCYDPPGPVYAVSCGENTSTLDAAAVLLAQRRTRDKQAMDGAMLKTADYYKYHYSDELDLEEKKPWWGQYDQ